MNYLGLLMPLIIRNRSRRLILPEEPFILDVFGLEMVGDYEKTLALESKLRCQRLAQTCLECGIPGVNPARIGRNMRATDHSNIFSGVSSGKTPEG